MKERYKNILEKVYEVEGLLLLAMSKEEIPQGLDELIERRLSELMADEEYQAQPAVQNDSTKIEETEIGNKYEEEESTFYMLEDNEEFDKPVAKEKKPPVFSLNDRFLFTRELFDGDAADFKAVISSIARFGSFSQARDYLMGECRINPEASETASRFLDIIESYFK